MVNSNHGAAAAAAQVSGLINQENMKGSENIVLSRAAAGSAICEVPQQQLAGKRVQSLGGAIADTIIASKQPITSSENNVLASIGPT